MQGRLITFEGTEGSGKSTQIQRLRDRLVGAGRQVRMVREPGGTPVGEAIRCLIKDPVRSRGICPLGELLLVNASRAQLVNEVIAPSLRRGAFVLCDRFFDSTLAYQGYGRGLELDRVRKAIDLAVGAWVPDLTILLEISLELSEERRRLRSKQGPAGRPEDRFETAGPEFFKRVARGYETLAREEPNRIRIVDGSRNELEVAREVWELVRRFLGLPSR